MKANNMRGLFKKVMPVRAIILFVFLVVFPSLSARPSMGAQACTGDTPYTFSFTNYCAFPVWVGQTAAASNNHSYPPQGGNWAVAAQCTAHKDCASGSCDGEKRQCVCTSSSQCTGGAACTNGYCTTKISFCMPQTWDSGTFWPRTGCTASGANLNCDTGQCTPEGETSGLLDCGVGITSPTNPVAQFEATINADGSVNYDISLAAGFNVEIKATPVGGSYATPGVPASSNKVACYDAGCTGDLNASCPTSLQVLSDTNVIGCLDPCTRCQWADPPADLKCTSPITVDYSGNGPELTIDCSGSAQTDGGTIAAVTNPISVGKTATFTVTPNTGYKTQSVTGCAGTLAGTNYTTGAITADCSVDASFAPETGSGPTTISKFKLKVPTYLDMYCAKNMADTNAQASPNQGTPVSFSQDDCSPGKTFILPTYTSGYTPPTGQGVCLWNDLPQLNDPHFNDYGWADITTGSTVQKNCGGTAPNYTDVLPDGTKCGGYLTTNGALFSDDGLGFTCQTVTFNDARQVERTAHLCLPPTTSGLGMCKASSGNLTVLYQGGGGPFNATWLTAGIQAGGGQTPYYETFKKSCAAAYTWQYDDLSAGFECDPQAVNASSRTFSGYEITFCGSKAPFAKPVAWGSGKLVAPFSGYGASSGIWSNDGTGTNWSSLSDWIPKLLSDYGSAGIAATFNTPKYDTGNGVWGYNGSAWSQLTDWVPSAMLSDGSGNLIGKFADYGASSGIWKYDGSSWTRISDWLPDGMVSVGSAVVSSFSNYGTGNGIWNYSGSGSSWTNITNWVPQGMSSWGSRLAAVFTNYGESGNGVWIYEGASWRRVTDWTPIKLLSWNGDSLLAGIFSGYGTGSGLWSYDGTSWTRLTDWVPTDITKLGTDGLIAVFNDYGDGGNGVWKYSVGQPWQQISNWIPDRISSSGDYITGVFSNYGSSGNGIWKYQGGSWTRLTDWLPKRQVP